MIAAHIDAIEIQGLHRKKYLNYRLPFQDNWLFLSAPNGVGKTTVLRMLYYYLSGQWGKLSPNNLQRICAYVEGKPISQYAPLKKTGSRLSKVAQNTYRKAYQSKIHPEVFDDLFSFKITMLQENSEEIAKELATDHNVHYPLVLSVIKKIVQDTIRAKALPIRDVEVLFLPTYRRIEHVVREVFPNFSEHLTTLLMRNVDALRIQHDYEQGDVEKVKAQVLSEIEAHWNSYHTTEPSINIQYDLTYQHLVGFGMEDVANKVKKFGFLAADYNEDAERRIDQFCELCNEFWEDKTLCYSNQTKGLFFSLPKYGGRQMHELYKLSSGEKQIVSLFAHLIFSEKPVFLILDEPELSLSDAWQIKMMDNFHLLREAGVLAGLLIATHSNTILKREGKYAQKLDDLRTSNAY